MSNKTDDLKLPIYLFHQGTNYKSYELLDVYKRQVLHGADQGAAIFKTLRQIFENRLEFRSI